MEVAVSLVEGSHHYQNSFLTDRDDLLRLLPYGETREYVQRVGLDYLIYGEVWAE